MKKIRKEELTPHVVILDSNIFWLEDKSKVVNPDFDSFWDKYSRDCKLSLAIPAIVEGELEFQQATSAIKSLNKMSQEMHRISAITNKRYSHRITETSIKKDVRNRFQKWLRAKNGIILATPINKIKWEQVIQCSIWRHPPFVLDARNPDNEKGFRDALILETLVDYCNENNQIIKIAFICNDGLLRMTTKDRLKSDNRFNVYESLEDFETYLKLTKEKLEDQFIRELIRKASMKFFYKEKKSGLYYSENIKQCLKDQYKKYFDSPEESDAALSLFGKGLVEESWEPLDIGTFWISNAQFLKIQKDDYYWSNRITFVQQYNKKTTLPTALAQFALSPNEKVLILSFFVTWKARISKNAQFRDISIEGIEMKKNSFHEITQEDRKSWKLEKPQ